MGSHNVVKLFLKSHSKYVPLSQRAEDFSIFADVHILAISHVKTKVQEIYNSTLERPSLHFGLVVLHIVILLPLATNGLI